MAMSLSAQFEGKWPHEKTVQIRVVFENVRPKKVLQFKHHFAGLGVGLEGHVKKK